MRLYLLKRIDRADWDQTRGAVVRARSPRHARRLMADATRFEDGASAWLDTARSTVRVLPLWDDTAGVVLTDYKAG